MSTRTTEDLTENLQDYLQAVEHLPEGARLTIHNTSWDDYERLLEALSDTRHLRVSYDRGTLEIMSPLREHEKYAKLIERLVYFIAEKLDLEVESYGIATWKKVAIGRGVEADACFYVGNLGRIAEQEDIDRESVPPPDIVVEIDITGDSRRKFPIYAALEIDPERPPSENSASEAKGLRLRNSPETGFPDRSLGVPEIWRYDGKNLRFYEPAGKTYREIPKSRFITGLKPAFFAEPLDQVKIKTQSDVMRAFAKRWRSLKP